MLVGPALFAIALDGFDDPSFATMAIFGATAALVFADFGGPVGERTRAYLLTAVLGALLLGAGTLASGSPQWSVALTFVFAVVIRFAGNLGPRWAAAVSPLLLAFLLGDLVPAPGSAAPGRMLGWVIGVLLATVAAVCGAVDAFVRADRAHRRGRRRGSGRRPAGGADRDRRDGTARPGRARRDAPGVTSAGDADAGPTVGAGSDRRRRAVRSSIVSARWRG